MYINSVNRNSIIYRCYVKKKALLNIRMKKSNGISTASTTALSHTEKKVMFFLPRWRLKLYKWLLFLWAKHCTKLHQIFYLALFLMHFVNQWHALYFHTVWAIFHSNQWSTTGLSKAMVCTVLSMEKCI